MGGGILFRYVTTVRPGRGYLIYVCYFRTVEWPTYGWLANLHVARSVDWSCGHAPLNVTNLDLIMWHGRCLSCTTTNNNWKACLREFFFFLSREILWPIQRPEQIQSDDNFFEKKKSFSGRLSVCLHVRFKCNLHQSPPCVFSTLVYTPIFTLLGTD